jgi:hypothetical protein
MVVERSAAAAARHHVEFIGARKRNSPKLRGRETAADYPYNPERYHTDALPSSMAFSSEQVFLPQ